MAPGSPTTPKVFPPSHEMAGRDGVNENRATSTVARSWAIYFIARTADRLGETLSDRPGDLRFLPSYMKKRLMYRTFKDECEENEVSYMSY